MTFKSVWVLGSTSDVSIALCNELAKKGCKRFHLLSRKSSDNILLIKSLKVFPNIKVTCEDIDLLESKIDISNFFKNDFDLYLISSGYLGNNNLAINNYEESLKIIKTNFMGLVPILTHIVSSERITKPGALWVFSSVAEMRKTFKLYLWMQNQD